MKTKIILVLTLFSVITTSLSAQPVRSGTGASDDFRSLQRDFNAWKKENDLGTLKGWKAFKRWEQETQMHTDAKGEPNVPTEYLQALTDAAERRKNRNSGKSALMTGNWYPVGPYTVPNNLTYYMENGMGRVNCVGFHPTDTNIYYVGVAQGGLWKTTDGGQSYIPLTDNLPITRISSITLDPQNPEILYISVCDFEYIGFGLFWEIGRKRHTHYGIGVYKSTDGGMSWSPTGLSFQQAQGDGSLIREVLVHPLNSNELLACGVSGMFRSTDAGSSWTLVHDSLFWDMIPDLANPGTVYAATGWVAATNTGSAGIYKSTDFGLTWSALNVNIPPRGSVQRIKLAQAPSNPSRIYAVMVDDVRGLYAVYRSNNAGSTWTLRYDDLNILHYYDGSGTGGQGTYDLGVAVHPNDADKLYVGGVNLWASEDGADTFQPAGFWTTSYGPSIHADVHAIQVQPQSGRIFLSCDGGLYTTGTIVPDDWNNLNNGGTFQTVWDNRSNGMNVTSFYRISSSKSSTGELLAGAQDNASFYYDGTAWHTINGGDGMDNIMDTTSAGRMIASSQYGYFSRTDDGGISMTGINPNVNGENGEWTTPIIADRNNFAVLYAGFENVTKSNDGGDTWSALSNFPAPPNPYGSELSALASGSSNPNVLVAARRVRYEHNNPGAVFRTANGGQSWTDITAGLPDSLFYTAAEIDPDNAAICYITMAGFSSGQKVYKTINGGQSWTNVSYNLPNIPVNAVKVLPGSGDVIIGCDVGVYVLESGSTVWQDRSAGLPNVIVSDIEFNPALNTMYVSTFGRGIWATDLDVFTSLAENSAKTGARLFPSPNAGRFTLELPEGGEVQLFSVDGRMVHQQMLQRGANRVEAGLSSGLYFARVRSGKSMEVLTFIVEK